MTTTSANSPKTLVTLVAIGASLGLVALTVWSVRLHRELEAAHAEIATLRRQPAPAESAAPEARVLRAHVTDLQDRLVAVAAGNAEVKPGPAVATPGATTAAPANPFAAMMGMMDSPAMRGQLALAQKRSLEAQYTDVFALFQFSPDQRKRFVDMMAELQVPLMESGIKLATGSLSPEEQAALEQKADEIGELMPTRIREFLGDDAKYKLFQQFMEQEAERNEVKAFQTNLSQSGLPPLTAAQATALTDLMYIERESSTADDDSRGDTAIPANAAANAIAETLRKQSLLDERIVRRAASVLNPEQLARLRRQQAENLEATKASADLAREMFGTDGVKFKFNMGPASATVK